MKGGGRMGRGGGRSPFQITLTAAQRRWLKMLVRKQTAQQRQVTRAKIVLLAAAGWTNAAIARKLGVAPNTACKWRKRYATQGPDGLVDRKRPGRPRVFPAAVVAEAKAIACELPATRGVPISRWSLAELRAEVLASGLVEAVSTTTLARWLAADALKPWRHHAWIFPRDPDGNVNLMWPQCDGLIWLHPGHARPVPVMVRAGRWVGGQAVPDGPFLPRLVVRSR